MAKATATSPRERRRLRHQQLSREQILDAAETVFGERGYHVASLREIAELAEFSVGALYTFFGSKEDLYARLYQRRGDEFARGMDVALAAERSPIEQLHGLADFQVSYLLAHPDWARLLLRTSVLAVPNAGASFDAAIREGFDRAMEQQAQLLRRGQRAGEIRAGDALVLAHLFSGLVSAYVSAGLGDRADRKTRMPLDELHAILDDTFRSSIRAGR